MPVALPIPDIQAALADLPGWSHEPDRPAIVTEFRFADFRTAWGFMSQCALYAEQHNHHPEWFNVWATVRVTLTTHDCAGVSQLDLDYARFMNAAADRLLD